MIGRWILLAILILFLGCSGEGSEDNRVCIVNDSFNLTPDNIDEIESEAGSNDLEVEHGVEVIAICGDPVNIDAVVGSDNPEFLSDFLAKGRYK